MSLMVCHTYSFLYCLFWTCHVIDGLPHIFISLLFVLDLPCHWWSATHIHFFTVCSGPVMSLMVCHTYSFLYCLFWACHVIDGLPHIFISLLFVLGLSCHWWSATHIHFFTVCSGPVMSLMVCHTYSFLYCLFWTCHVIDGLPHILISLLFVLDLPCHWWSATHIHFFTVCSGPVMSLMVCHTYSFLYCLFWTCHVIDGLPHILISLLFVLDLPCHWWSATHIHFFTVCSGPVMSLMVCHTYSFLYCLFWTCHVIDGLPHILISLLFVLDLPCHWWSATHIHFFTVCSGPVMSLMVCHTYSFLYCLFWACHVIDGLPHIFISLLFVLDLSCHWWSATHINFFTVCSRPVMSLMVCHTYSFLYCLFWTCHVIDGLPHIFIYLLFVLDLSCHWWSATHIHFFTVCSGPVMSLMVCHTYSFLYCLFWTCHVIDGLPHIFISLLFVLDLSCHWWSATHIHIHFSCVLCCMSFAEDT